MSKLITFLFSVVIFISFASKEKMPSKYLTDNQTEQTASISGILCYPSEFIPAMAIYLKNVESDSIYRDENSEGDSEFHFDEIPPGKYVVYAYTKEKLEKRYNDPLFYKAFGGYTQMVPCGLSVECKDHSLIVIEVKSGQKIRDIQLCDWYGAIVPEEK